METFRYRIQAGRSERFGGSGYNHLRKSVCWLRASKCAEKHPEKA